MENYECECGFIVRGVNQSQLQQNINVHRGSKKHKELMEIKARKEQKKLG
jgi:hypothetical protein